MDYTALSNVLEQVNQKTSSINHREKRAIFDVLSKTNNLPQERLGLEEKIKSTLLMIQEYEDTFNVSPEVENFADISRFAKEKIAKNEELLKLFDSYSKLSKKLQSYEQIITNKKEFLLTLAKEIRDLISPFDIDISTLPFPLTQETLEALGCNLADFPFQLATSEKDDDCIDRIPEKIDPPIEKKEKIVLSLEERKRIHEFLLQKIETWVSRMGKYNKTAGNRLMGGLQHGTGKHTRLRSKQDIEDGLTGYQLLFHKGSEGPLNQTFDELIKIRNYGEKVLNSLKAVLAEEGMPEDYDLRDLHPEEWGGESYKN